MPVQNFEAVLLQTGWGIFNKFVLFICSASIFASTMALTTLPFALSFPIYFREYNESDILWINAALPLGMFVGNIVFGLLSDIVSRKCVFTATLVISFIMSFAFGFTFELMSYIIFSFLLGFSTSANILTAKVYLSEILPIHHRGHYLVYLEIISVAGYLISSCLNWVILNRYNHVYPDTEECWRLAFGLPTCLCLLIICFSGLLQPNPRELLAKNSIGAAHIVAKYMFAINTSDHTENFKINLIDLRGLIEGKSLNVQHSSRCYGYLFRMCVNVVRIVSTITSRKLYYLFLVAIIRCSLSIGYSITSIWLTKSLHINFTKECTMKFIDVLSLVPMSTNSVPKEFKCFISASQFFEYFSLGGAMFLGLFIFSYVIDSIGRRVPLIIGLLSTGLAITNYPLFESFLIRLGFSMAYMMAFSIANATLDIIIIENSPTSIRATSLTLSHAPAIFLTMLSRLLISMECKTIFYLVGGSTIVASGFCYFLPDLKNLPMVE